MKTSTLIVNLTPPLFALCLLGAVVAALFDDWILTGVFGFLALVAWLVIEIYVKPYTYSSWKRPTP